MAEIENVRLEIAGIGHAYTAPVDTAPFDLDTYTFIESAQLSSATHTDPVLAKYKTGTWTWMGDISAENLIEFEVDGGDITQKRTHDRLNVRAVREAESITGTVNKVNAAAKDMELAFPGGTYDADTRSYGVRGGGGAREVAFFFVIEDGPNASGLYLPHIDLKGRFPTFSLEELTEFPISMAVLDSVLTGEPWRWFEPRERTNGATAPKSGA